jgi:S-adenosylmethionine hydrolase
MSPPLITFLSDYGLADEFVGVCHAVIAGICPSARVIDLTHGIPRQDTRAGALALLAAVPYLPVGVHLAIVDPEVGGRRRAVALASGNGRTFVGPDNGLLWLAAEAAGGVTHAVEISHSPFRLEPVAATFLGRDLFAPVAARLAAGATLGEAGPPLEPAGLVRLELPRAEVRRGEVRAHVLRLDGYGNAQLDATHEQLAAVGLQLGRRVSLTTASGEHEAVYVRTFAEAPRDALLIYEDAARRLAVAVNMGSAAARLALVDGGELVVRGVA